MMEADAKYRQYVVENFNLNDPDDYTAQQVVRMYTRRWYDFLERITDNDKGADGESFAEKWQVNRKFVDLDGPHFRKGAISSVFSLADKLFPNLHKDEFAICVKLHDDYIVQ